MLRLVFRSAVALALAWAAAGAVQAQDAKQLFDFYCAQCHGTKGNGKGINVTKDFATDPRDFTNKAEMEKRTDADIRAVIKDGGPAISKSPLMPPWGHTLAAAEVEALLGYVRKLCSCKGPGG